MTISQVAVKSIRSPVADEEEAKKKNRVCSKILHPLQYSQVFVVIEAAARAQSLVET
jgi:hypothetical protein